MVATFKTRKERESGGNAGQEHKKLSGIGKAEVARGPVFEPIARHVIDEYRDKRKSTQPINSMIALGWTARSSSI